jgi:predicted HTH domain antitoxin
MLCSLIVVVIACAETGSAFVPMRTTAHHQQKQMAFLIHTTPDKNICWSRSRLHESAAQNDETAAVENEQDTDIGSMRVSEMKQELQRRNVSSKDCFDRESLVERLLQARQNPQPQSSPQESQPEQSTSSSESESSTTATATTSVDETTSTAGTTETTKDAQSPQELKEEVAALSVRELRIELAGAGIRWAGMLEKRDLVDAVVKCRQETAQFSVTGLMRPGQVADLTGEELAQELQSTDTLVLLDVYATW